jgi:hypothetical protein
VPRNQEGTDLLDAQVLNSVSARHDRDVLDSCLRSWQEANPEARVEILSD